MSIASGGTSTPTQSDHGPAPSLNSFTASSSISSDSSNFLEHARRDVDDRVEQNPDDDDEVPVDAVFRNVHEPLALDRPYEHEGDEHDRVHDVRQKVHCVEAHVDPDNRAVRVLVPGAVQ